MALGFRRVGASWFVNLRSVRLVEARRWAVVLDAMAKAKAKPLASFLLSWKELAIRSEDHGQVLVRVVVLGQSLWRGQ